MVPFTIGKTYKQLVVDGNHRITTAIKEKKEIIKAYILEPQMLVDYSLFCSSFDLLYYVFQNEVVYIGSLFHVNTGISELDIINKSFLNNKDI